MGVRSARLRVGGSGRTVILHALDDGVEVPLQNLSGPLPTITVGGVEATIDPDEPLWLVGLSHVVYRVSETIARGDVVRFTDGGGGAPIVASVILIYMDPANFSGWRGSHYHLGIGGSGAPNHGAKWNITLPSSGEWKVAFTWPFWADGSNVTNFKVFDNGGLVRSGTVDQSALPNGFSANGTNWNYVNNGASQIFNFATTNAEVRITGEGTTNKRIMADGLLLERVSDGLRVFGDDVGSAGSGAYEVASGVLPALVNAVVDSSRVGYLPADCDPPPSRTMAVGTNLLTSGAYYDAVKIYWNIMKACTTLGNASNSDPDGYPLPGYGWQVIVSQPSYIYGANKGFPDLNPGAYTLTWDGPGVLSLQSVDESPGVPHATVTLVESVLTGGVGNRRTYNVQKNLASTSEHYFLIVVPDLTNGGVTNWSLRPPDAPSDGSGIFNAKCVDDLGRGAAIRFMTSVRINGATHIDYADFGKRTDASQAWHSQSIRSIPIASIGSFDSNAFWGTTGFRRALVTTTVPHGLRTNHLVAVSGGPSATAVVGYVDGSTREWHNFRGMAYVVSPTTFALGMLDAGHVVANAPYDGTGKGATVTVDLLPGMPVDDIIDLCNEAESDLWLCVPHGLTDAAVTALFDRVAERLLPQLKVYAEYSNEAWNTLADFTQFWYCAGKSNQLGLAPVGDPASVHAMRYYCRRATEVHVLGRAAFAARGRAAGDVVRVLGGQWGNASRTGDMAAYCASQGYPVDAIAFAPYEQNRPEALVGYDYSGFNGPQCLDVYEATVDGLRPAEIALAAQHRAALAAHGYDPEFLSYECCLNIAGLSGDPTTQAAQSIAASFHPGMARVYNKYFETMDLCGFTLAMHFGYFSAPYTEAWATQRHGTLYHQLLGTYQRPGRGDGTDGENDNRAATSTVPATIPTLRGLAAPVLRAIGEWNSILTDAPGLVAPGLVSSPRRRRLVDRRRRQAERDSRRRRRRAGV